MDADNGPDSQASEADALRLLCDLVQDANNHCPEKLTLEMSNALGVLCLAHKRRTPLAPRPDGEATAWPAGVLNREKTLEVLTHHNEWRRGGPGNQTDPVMLGRAIDAAIAAITKPEQAGPGADWREHFGEAYAAFCSRKIISERGVILNIKGALEAFGDALAARTTTQREGNGHG